MYIISVYITICLYAHRQIYKYACVFNILKLVVLYVIGCTIMHSLSVLYFLICEWWGKSACRVVSHYLFSPHILWFVVFHHLLSVVSEAQTFHLGLSNLSVKILLWRVALKGSGNLYSLWKKNTKLWCVFWPGFLSQSVFLPFPPTFSHFVVPDWLLKCNLRICSESGSEANPKVHVACCWFLPAFVLLIVVFESKLYFWSLYYSEGSELHST